MRQIFALLKRIASTDSTLLLVGETGSGKGAAAKAIHKLLAARARGRWWCSTAPRSRDNLIESELFGHEKGAFTGAVDAARRLPRARRTAARCSSTRSTTCRWTCSPSCCARIEDREFRRLGASSSAASRSTRAMVAATKKDLWAETQAGRFREDLYFRLSVFTVSLPPLRDRKEDIPLLVDAFAGEPLWDAAARGRCASSSCAHTWPGNVRELRNAIERARHMADIPELSSGLAAARVHAGPRRTEGEVLPASYGGPVQGVQGGAGAARSSAST